MTDKTTSNDGLWAEQTHASDLMHTVLGHYATHRMKVLRKLELAQKASKVRRKKKEISETKGVTRKAKLLLKSSSVSESKTESPLWLEIIELFKRKTVFEDDLFYIEDILDKMPSDIQKEFKLLARKDRILINIEKKIDTEAYFSAKKRIAKIQNQKNPLSGMTAEEYDGDFLSKIRDILFSDEE